MGAMLGGLAGGIELFLLGMWLMTEGLKLAAGPSLQRALARSTGTPLRGLASGIAVTALVQSSSAVTVAAIGFVNAGLLTLGQSLWVLFGANVGTTATRWPQTRLDARWIGNYPFSRNATSRSKPSCSQPGRTAQSVFPGRTCCYAKPASPDAAPSRRARLRNCWDRRRSRIRAR